MGENKRMIIGILGHSQHGKDSIGDVLCKYENYSKDYFAKPIKDCMKILFPKWTNDHLYGKLKDVIDTETGIKPRSAMICFGEKFARGDLLRCDDFSSVTGLSVFVKSLENRIKNNTAVCDIRKHIEAESIKKLGGIVIKVERPGYPVDDNEGESEVDFVKYDYLVVNNGTLVDLEYKVCDLYEKHLIFKE